MSYRASDKGGALRTITEYEKLSSGLTLQSSAKIVLDYQSIIFDWQRMNRNTGRSVC